jgi:hypothetical protein
MNWLGLRFTATECNGWPSLRFLIDDDLYQDFTFHSSEHQIRLPLDLLDGSHILSIEFYGKTYSNTLVENDVIIKDQLTTLESIMIDDVILPDFVKYSGVYCIGDISIPQALTWGQNGVWELKFDVPIIDWVLDLKFQNFYEFSSTDRWATATYHPEKIRLLREGLTELENLLSNVKI